MNVKTGETSWTRPDDTTSELAKTQAEAKRKERHAKRAKVIEELKQQEDKAMKELKHQEEQLLSVEGLLQLTPHDQELQELRKSLKELVDLQQKTLLQAKKERLRLEYSAATSASETSAAAATPTSDKQPASKAGTSAAASATAAAITGCSGKDGPVIVRSSASLLDRAEASAGLTAGMSIVPETRCMAPFSTSYGMFAYHDAIIHKVDPDGVHCSVLFVTPMYNSMLPCKEYLAGTCTRGEACVFSHGHHVAVQDLRPHQKVDYAALSLGCLCLFRPLTEKLWQYGSLVATADETSVVVRPHFGGDALLLPLKNIRPVPGLSVDEANRHSSDEGGEGDDESEGHDDDVNEGEEYGTSSESGKTTGHAAHGHFAQPKRAKLAKGDGRASEAERKRRQLKKRAGARMPEETGDFAPIVYEAQDVDFGKWERFSRCVCVCVSECLCACVCACVRVIVIVCV